MKLCARMMLVVALVVGLLLAVPGPAVAEEIDFGMYAAVAYSPSTGKYGYGWNYPTLGQAQRRALSYCTPPDARIVGWVRGGWLVLAVGDDKSHGVAWEHGDGAVNGEAINLARAELRDRGAKLKTLVVVCSGDIDPKIYEFAAK